MEVDPISSTWSPLPPPPDHHLLLFRHPSISRHLPIKTVYAAGKLVLLAATDRHLLPALPSPSLFDPNTTQWIPAPALSFSPRRCCTAGSAGGALYVESGVGSEYSSETARSAERWDMLSLSRSSGGGGGWEAVFPLKAQASLRTLQQFWVFFVRDRSILQGMLKELHHPKCVVCHQFIPTNRPSLIEYRAHPFGAKSTALLMNTTYRYDVAAVRKWRGCSDE